MTIRFCPKVSMMIRLSPWLLAALLAGCSNPFAPEKTVPTDVEEKPPAELTTTPEIVMANLERSFSDRDKDLYDSILDDSFWYSETDCLGEFVLINDKEQELQIMGTRDGSNQGIFDIFRTIEWTFQQSQRYTELGRDYPQVNEDDIDGHPAEDWEVFRGRVEILLLRSADDGFRVSQIMNFKLRQGDDDLWRIVRWISDPLSGDCGDGDAGRPVSTSMSWGQVKR
ncbi:MAG: hypothetical protein HN712_18840 [Gemmatimonadetes bacterium]|jgi:hypothetical protein|nr:hypothetical protein [Gemmatimonadota bacterium]MBT6147835.1 hypothetical protein [Gemmatimonadota bacterium]MBT7862381.1 hypothetical protein [Gemmatimonadota bacterium]